MDLLVNDRSIHGQFVDFATFRDAISRVMAIRAIVRSFGRELYCHRNITHAQVTHNLMVLQAVGKFSVDKKRSLMQWLTRQGPFWEDKRTHGQDDYLAFKEDVVTDTAVGEAAYCGFHGSTRELVSLIPSEWMFTPVPVTWVRDSSPRLTIDVINHWERRTVEASLEAAPPSFTSWQEVESAVARRFSYLTFAKDAFTSLVGHPFAFGAAQRINVLLGTLNGLKQCFDENGRRTAEGDRLYRDHFTGDKAWFSDSSDTEKRKFKTDLKFRHPLRDGERLFCPWHGKVKTPQYRIHFSWPVRADEPCYVVYIGPKITKP